MSVTARIALRAEEIRLISTAGPWSAATPWSFTASAPPCSSPSAPGRSALTSPHRLLNRPVPAVCITHQDRGFDDGPTFRAADHGDGPVDEDAQRVILVYTSAPNAEAPDWPTTRQTPYWSGNGRPNEFHGEESRARRKCAICPTRTADPGREHSGTPRLQQGANPVSEVGLPPHTGRPATCLMKPGRTIVSTNPHNRSRRSDN